MPRKPPSPSAHARHRRFQNRRLALLALLLLPAAVLLVLQRLGRLTLDPEFANAIKAYLVSLVSFFAASLLVRLTERRFFHFLEDEMAIEARIVLTKAWTWVLYLIALAITLKKLGVDTTEISVVLGFATAGVAFAIRDTLASLVAWLVLLFKKPFRIGDCIAVEGLSGRVERIGTFFVSLDTGIHAGHAVIARLPVRLAIEKPLVNYGVGDRVPVELALPLEKVPTGNGKRLDVLRHALAGLPEQPTLIGLAFVAGENSCRLTAGFLVPLERRIEIQPALLDLLAKAFRAKSRR